MENDNALLPWYKSTYMRNLSVLVLTLVSLFLVHMIFPLLNSIFSFIYAVLFPFLLSLIIYYAVRPLVQKLRTKMPVHIAIGIIYILLIGFTSFIVFYVYPQIINEIIFVKTINFQIVIDNIFRVSNSILKTLHLNVSNQEETKTFISMLFNKVNDSLTNNVIDVATTLTTVLFDICIIPFILFFLLKDDRAIYSSFYNQIPLSYQKRINEFLVEVDKTLVHFITGRVIVSACVCIMLFFAFLVIGIRSSYILASVAFVFFIIPSVGWILASVLPILVGFSMGMTMGVEVLCIMITAAVLEGLWLTPEILGKSLMIHPLTIILLLLAAGYLYGIVGLIFITPAYALLKVLAIHIYKEFAPSQE
ncbi:MAG: AI-2E family transporter [Chlamydiales bacterium]|nr:AI-2E family transporter [Chlamydiia bacterium]MCP5507138.1 AI-2E family transporter [Chlamydiales bacterium]